MGRKQRLRALFFFVARYFEPASRHLLALLLPLVLAGCASGSNLLFDVVSGVVAERWGADDDPTIHANLNPNYRYLRVESIGRPPALLVLGYVEPDPRGEVEVWYSAKQEVIKTRNGRIVATFGLETDWRAVRFSPEPVPWSAVAGDVVAFERVRDEMPGYRYALSEQVETQAWPGSPPQGFSPVLKELGPDRLLWFRESVIGARDSRLPPSWYALGVRGGKTTVLYSEQCLARGFCLRLTRWPLQDGAG